MQAKDAGTLAAVPPEGSTGSSPGTARHRAASPLPTEALQRRQAPACFAHWPGKPAVNTGGPVSGTRCSARTSPSPSWPKLAATRETPTSKSRLSAGGRSRPPTALPTRNPPGQGGITVKNSIAGKAPYQARRADRRAPEGPGGAPAEHRVGSGQGEVPGSISVPSRAPAQHQAQLVARLGHAEPTVAGSPIRRAPALPRHRRRFLSPRTGVCTGAATETPASEKRLRKEMEKAGGEQEGLQPPLLRRGVLRGIWGSPPRRGAWPRCQHRAALQAIPHLGKPRHGGRRGAAPHPVVCAEPPPTLWGRETLPPHTHPPPWPG